MSPPDHRAGFIEKFVSQLFCTDFRSELTEFFMNHCSKCVTCRRSILSVMNQLPLVRTFFPVGQSLWKEYVEEGKQETYEHFLKRKVRHGRT